MYILYFKSYEWECTIHVIIINKPQISVAVVWDIYPLLLAKRVVLRSLLSEGCYFQLTLQYYTPCIQVVCCSSDAGI